MQFHQFVAGRGQDWSTAAHVPQCEGPGNSPQDHMKRGEEKQHYAE